MPSYRSIIVFLCMTLSACFAGVRERGSFGGDSMISFCVISMRPQCEYEAFSLPTKSFRVRLDRTGVFRKLNSILGQDTSIGVVVRCDTKEETIRNVDLPAGFFPGTCVYIDDGRLSDQARKYRLP